MIFGFEKSKKVSHNVEKRVSEIRRKPFVLSRRLGKGMANRPVRAKEYYLVNDPKHKIELAVKRQKTSVEAESDYRMYRKCREAGLPVPVTYGIDKKSSRTLFMTDLTLGGELLVESWSNDKFDSAPLSSISNIDELAHTIAWSAIFASAANINLSNSFNDAQLFQFPKGGGNVPVMFSIVDFELMDIDKNSTPFGEEGVDKRARVLVNGLLAWLRNRGTNSGIIESIKADLLAELRRICPGYIKTFREMDSIKVLPRQHKNGILSAIPTFSAARK